MQPPTSPAMAIDVKHWRWAFVTTFAIVTVLTHLPRTEVLDKAHVPPDKLIHFAAFGVLALLLVRCRWMPAAAALVLLACWIPLDEWTQSIISPSREFEWADIAGGWLGVATIATLCRALRQPGIAAERDGWTQLNTAFDSVTHSLDGGLLPCLTGATVFLVTLLSTYMVFWIGLEQSQGTIAMVIGLAAGASVAWALVRRAWARRAKPTLPQVAPYWWLITLGFMAVAWIVGGQLASLNLPGQAAPLAFFIGFLVISFPIRPAMLRACAAAAKGKLTNG